ncbi:MAG: thioredoxin family protein [archaeon]|nr:thioredoxin family protein [archaeon]MCP8320367.1 thioredoxin family protein [archaeon]
MSRSKPILLDFTAKWCSTCRVLDLMIEKHIRPKYKDEVKFVKIDINEHEDLTEKYDILSIPTLILCTHDGEEMWRSAGHIDVDKIKEKLDRYLSVKKGSG